VLDTWFEREVKPRLLGRATLVRYADDAVLLFGQEPDAHRVMHVLSKRFGKYGLTVHPEKTRLVNFRRPDLRLPPSRGATKGIGSFDLLGFTHFWSKSLTGKWIVKRSTAKDRFRRALQRVSTWCRTHLHDSLRAQQQALAQKLRGHFGYFGIIGNSEALGRFRHEVIRVWRKWLDRRSQRARMNWDRMNALLEHYALPTPRIRAPSIRAANP
jgi:hypothetical protein